MSADIPSGIIQLDSVDSTNTYARENFETLADGSIVVAREQLAGRGRLGRKWVTPPGCALTASAVLKNVSEPFHAGMLVGLAGLYAARKFVPGSFVFFKYPNDIYVRREKLGGILSEGILSDGKICGVVSGLGLNVNQSAAELAELDNPAVSIAVLRGENVAVDAVRDEFAVGLAAYYELYKHMPEMVFNLWKSENALIGQILELALPSGEIIRGRFEDIDGDGSMIVDTESGKVRFCCGDVKIIPEKIDFEALENSRTKKIEVVL